jgi:hypothetical protein
MTMVAAPALRQRSIAVLLQAPNPFSPVRNGLGSNEDVSGEVDQVRALLAEEVIVEVRLHQGQGFTGALFFFGSLRTLLVFQFSQCAFSLAKE